MEYVPTWETFQPRSSEPEQKGDLCSGVCSWRGTQQRGTGFPLAPSSINVVHSLYCCSKGQEVLRLAGFEDVFRAGVSVQCSGGRQPASSPWQLLCYVISDIQDVKHMLTYTLHTCGTYISAPRGNEVNRGSKRDLRTSSSSPWKSESN